MAPSKLLLSLTILTSLLSLSTSTRPCKTLFISSYSFSIKPLYPNPNPNPNKPSSGFLTIVTEIQQTSSSTSSSLLFNRRFFPTVLHNNYDNTQIKKTYDGLEENRREEGSLSFLPWGLNSYDMSSLRDRTKDILSVVVALLFGVGCGALTAATMYLVWSLFASPRYDYLDEFSDADDEVASPKKMGYVKVPEAEPVKGAA